MHAACASPPSWQLKRRRWWHLVQHCPTAFAHERQPQVLVPVLGLGLGLVQGRGQGQMLWHLPQAVLEARVDDEALAVELAEPILMQLAGQAPQPLAVLQTQMLHAPAMTKKTMIASTAAHAGIPADLGGTRSHGGWPPGDTSASSA